RTTGPTATSRRRRAAPTARGRTAGPAWASRRSPRLRLRSGSRRPQHRQERRLAGGRDRGGTVAPVPVLGGEAEQLEQRPRCVEREADVLLVRRPMEPAVGGPPSQLDRVAGDPTEEVLDRDRLALLEQGDGRFFDD